ncbi:GNAT family N-acetyltransferase [Paracoccus sp. SM22M-07]|uniref:GNAT family N-acetyltransferase n=1 Tax=Paracoccus sp. SM22M-07 TaxID=1520813 RepID=UPI0009141865|nr:GNAT family N-acetyltransferase [Paracoccus sp. SM22M-07]OJH45511.1 hypothetical protein IE00_04025 [Paracoccus sp. SM22M-07]
MTVHFRRARGGDLPAIVALLTDDRLGAAREAASAAGYAHAFARIDADPNQLLVVAEDEGQVIGTLQLTFTQGLSRGGAIRGQIEAVRIAGHLRGQGIGQRMIEWAIAACRSHGCAMVQLTTDKTRVDAHRFYDRLGFEQSHLGYKLIL